ncbi:hypothetical protein EDD22DRAFT_853063 [Suillus occidentalis]|nr:hypothetical protein EDD22DRAFT_853063 [Suillus occidentalis]
MAPPKHYQRDGPTMLDRQYADSQLFSQAVPSQVDEQGALAQAILTKEADVKWRRLRTLATAWEIYAMEQHQRFLQMILEDDGQTYTSAAAEPLATSVEALSSCSIEELQEQIDICKVMYDSDVTLFATGDSQLDLIEDIACAQLGDGAGNRWSLEWNVVTGSGFISTAGIESVWIDHGSIPSNQDPTVRYSVEPFTISNQIPEVLFSFLVLDGQPLCRDTSKELHQLSGRRRTRPNSIYPTIMMAQHHALQLQDPFQAHPKTSLTQGSGDHQFPGLSNHVEIRTCTIVRFPLIGCNLATGARKTRCDVRLAMALIETFNLSSLA